MLVATWNVNGIRARQDQFIDWLQRDCPDVVCLQETKASREQLSEVLCELPEYWCYWHGAAKGYSGVSVHLRKTTFANVPNFSHPAFDSESRIVAAEANGIIFESVYMPNGGKDFPAKMVFMRKMADHVCDVLAQGKSLIVCGDMNVARTDGDVHPSQVKPGTIGQLPEERAILEEMIGHGLIDVGRSLDPENQRLFTWWPYWRDARKRNLGWRLDYILVSKNCGLRPVSCDVLRDFGTSDHAPVIARLE